jgi:hypothetical protein
MAVAWVELIKGDSILCCVALRRPKFAAMGWYIVRIDRESVLIERLFYEY